MRKKFFAMKDGRGNLRLCLDETAQEAIDRFTQTSYVTWKHAEAAGYNVVELEIREAQKDRIIMGQEAICPKGLGRVIAVEDGVAGLITVRTYACGSEHKWMRKNIELIDPRTI